LPPVGKPGPARDGERGAGELERGRAFGVAGKLKRLMRGAKDYTSGIDMLVYSLTLACWNPWCKFNNASI
jgi:hypothetical protein